MPLSAPILIVLSALLTVLNKPALIRKAAINQYNHGIFHYYVLGKFNVRCLDRCVYRLGLYATPMLWAIMIGKLRWFGSTPLSLENQSHTTRTQIAMPGMINPNVLFGSALKTHPSLCNMTDLWWQAASHDMGPLRQLHLAVHSFIQARRG